MPRTTVGKETERRRAWIWGGMVGLQLAGTTVATLAQESGESQLEDMACLAALADLGVQAEPASLNPAEEDCVVEQPVRLHSMMSERETLEFAEPPTLACSFAVVLSRWLAESAIPAARSHLGQPPAKVLAGPGHACRPRNQQPGAELSVHAFGIALDIRGFELPDGEQIMIEPGDHGATERAFLEALRTSACDYFSTVLGPGSDRHHDDHLHVDLERHGESDEHRICQ